MIALALISLDAALLIRRSDRLPGLFGDLEPNRPDGLLLPNRRPLVGQAEQLRTFDEFVGQ
jgi:hypothetical protein